MPTKKQLSLKLSIVILFLFALSLVLLLLVPSLHKKNVQLLGEEKVNFPLPIRIKIPAINVDAPVDQVGLASDGTMDVPTLPSSTAWYELGPHPGEMGSAVINGHAGWKNGIPAVFDYLYKLHIGDKIYVEDDKGIITTFVVRKKETYKYDEDARDVFGSNDGSVHLNLITCSGVWNELEKTHSDRLVIFADKE